MNAALDHSLSWSRQKGCEAQNNVADNPDDQNETCPERPADLQFVLSVSHLRYDHPLKKGRPVYQILKAEFDQ